MDSVGTLTVLAAVASLAVYILLRNPSRHALPLPPGPKPLPLLGNLFDVPVVDEYKVYTAWGAKYGDVVHFSALGRRIVVLGSAAAAQDLLDARSAIYSDRPAIPMLHDAALMDVNWAFPIKRFAPEWRRQRRLFTHHLGPAASRPAFLDALRASAHPLLRSLLRAPRAFVAHLKHASAASMLAITYGYRMQSMDDPLVTLAERAVKMATDGTLPTRFVVDVFPWLKYVPTWFPGAGFKRFAAEGREIGRKHVELPFAYAKQRMDQGAAFPSFVTSALTHAASDDIIDIKQVAAAMYGGGTETTFSTMRCCVLALVLNPAVQERAHAELDGVLGRAASPSFRLPTFEDRPDLPYIDAIVKETLRWFPVIPNGVPHATTADDVYRGWRIPRGTIVIANSWAMLHNAETYPDPFAFRPERFLGARPAPHPGSQGCFGFGRRECPGRHLAELSLWIQIASILAVFTLSPGTDDDGREIDVGYAREPPPNLIIHPQEFPCVFTPRSSVAEMRIREADAGQGPA